MRPDVPAWRRSAAFLALSLAVAVPAVAADKPCAKADAAAAEKAVDRVVSWAAMHKAWKDYGHCDTDNVAMVFSDALMRMIVSNWPKFAELEPAFTNDTAYRDWILDRVGGGKLSKGDVDDIHDLTQNSCPKGQKRLCDALHAAAEKAQGKAAPPPKPAAPAPATPAPAPSAPPKPAS